MSQSKFSYSASVYASLKTNVLDELNPIHNSAIRLATLAFRTLPTISLLIESAKPSSLVYDENT